VQPVAPTLAQRILAHLGAHPCEEGCAEAPGEVTQEGIAEALDARVAHVSRALKGLMAAGLVKAHLAHAGGSRRRCRVHLLTAEGQAAAKGLPAPPRKASIPSVSPRAAIRAGPPAGRARAFAGMESMLEEAGRGSLRALLVEGDSGSGKTRLLRAFAAASRAKGVRVLEGASVPVGEAQILGPLAGAFAGTSFEARLKAWGGGAPRERALHAAVDALADAARAGPVLVVLDDIQHAGPTAVEFLHGLLLALPPTTRLLCVIAFRREEGWQLPNGPLYTALFPLRSLPQARHLTLGPLDAAGVAALLADAGMAHVSGDALARVVRESHGNALYALAMGGALADGVDEEDFFPPAVRALAKERFMTLEPRALDLLQIMAVVGAETTYDHLATCWDEDEDELVDALDVLLDKLLVEEVPRPGDAGPTLRFEHPKVREAVLADLTASRRRWLEARVSHQR
jgi:DNA-binding MarR family transcriptional regulator